MAFGSLLVEATEFLLLAALLLNNASWKFRISGKEGIKPRSIGRGFSQKYELLRQSSAEIRLPGSNLNKLFNRRIPEADSQVKRCFKLLYGWCLNVKFLAAGRSANDGQIFSFGDPSISMINCI